MPRKRLPSSAAKRARKERARSGMSSRRARSEGSADREHVQAIEQVLAEAPLLDKIQTGSCWWPRSAGCRRAPLAARRRDRPRPPGSPATASPAPASGNSPISSRNSVPPFASTNLPTCRSVAPVKAPFSWPKSVDSTRLSGIAPQLTVTNGLPLRSPDPWIARASTSLPTPDLALDQDRDAGLRGPLGRGG